MANKELVKQLANVPIAQPGFDALNVSAPVIVQINPDGKWEKKKPDCLDEERLKSVVQHLMKSNAVSAAQSYCCQCALENKNSRMESNYVPVIMMPIYPADQCPFDIECEVQKMKAAEDKSSKKPKRTDAAKDDNEDKENDKSTKLKKRGFVMQRLTDFDLLSQW